MFNYFIMSNDIDFSMSDSELFVQTYLYSIKGFTNLYGRCVKVKQETIAKACKISTATVARALKGLMQKGIIINKVRSIKSNGHLSTCYYVLKPVDESYFMVYRKALKLLSARLIKPYLFICRSAKHKTNSCYQSYSDIAVATGIKRTDVLSIIKELNELGLIRKRKKITKSGDYTDNTYFVVGFILARIFKKGQKKMSRFGQSKLINCILRVITSFKKHCTSLFWVCQGFLLRSRGSPHILGRVQYDRSIILPTSLYTVRKRN